MPLAPESKETQAENLEQKVLDYAAQGIFETVLEDPELGLILGGITVVVVIVWTIIRSFFELMGGPPQNLFG